MKKPKMSKISKKAYYENMSKFQSSVLVGYFDVTLLMWFDCFTYIVRQLEPTATAQTVKALFYDFKMDNWTAFHRDRTQYVRCTTLEMCKHFAAEASYISDRISWDRLFRTHWLFRQAYGKELEALE